MKTNKVFRSVLAGLALALFAAGSVAQADVVYDNSTGDLNVRLNPGTFEIGDEIILGPGSRIITDFTFQYWGEGFAGNDEEARVRFYLNDGPNSQAGPAEPSTLFYDSDWFDIAQTTRATLIFTDFTTDAIVPLTGALPDTFTWTVTFRGVGGAGESAGVDLYNPPTVGGNYLEYWENTGPGGWEYRGDSGGTPANFAARIGVVPEPGVMALGLIGGLAALMMRNRFKRA